jgi:hypothetical protein
VRRLSLSSKRYPSKILSTAERDGIALVCKHLSVLSGAATMHKIDPAKDWAVFRTLPQ